MLEHNFASIRYSDYHIFAGCYPNDAPTQEAVRAASARFGERSLGAVPPRLVRHRRQIASIGFSSISPSYEEENSGDQLRT